MSETDSIDACLRDLAVRLDGWTWLMRSETAGSLASGCFVHLMSPEWDRTFGEHGAHSEAYGQTPVEAFRKAIAGAAQ